MPERIQRVDGTICIFNDINNPTPEELRQCSFIFKTVPNMYVSNRKYSNNILNNPNWRELRSGWKWINPIPPEIICKIKEYSSNLRPQFMSEDSFQKYLEIQGLNHDNIVYWSDEKLNEYSQIYNYYNRLPFFMKDVDFLIWLQEKNIELPPLFVWHQGEFQLFNNYYQEYKISQISDSESQSESILVISDDDFDV